MLLRQIRPRLGRALIITLSFSACSTGPDLERLKSSESCYTPFTERAHPKPSGWPLKEKVPWIETEPPGSRRLGDFKISADFATVLRAVEYNAKRVGADAVLINKINWWDLKDWAEPRTVRHTKTTPPTENEWKEYEKQRQAYERSRAEGKKTSPPERPKDTKETFDEDLPGRWTVQGSAYLEAIFLETPSPVKERFRVTQQTTVPPVPRKSSGENRGKLSQSILDQAGPRNKNSPFSPPPKPKPVLRK